MAYKIILLFAYRTLPRIRCLNLKHFLACILNVVDFSSCFPHLTSISMFEKRNKAVGWILQGFDQA